MRSVLAWFLGILAASAAIGAEPGERLHEELVVLRTRPKVQQAYLLCTVGGEAPRAVALFFAGDTGRIGLPRDGTAPRLNPQGNFLVRSRALFCSPELAVALVDAPSDQPTGMTDAFRAGREHVQDIDGILRDLRGRWPQVPAFLVGTSRGTLSAAFLAVDLGERIQGVVLTSTVFVETKQTLGLERFDFRRIKAPLLFVHHAADECTACPYGPARRLGASRALITVTGGSPAESGACQPLSAHGYFGREAPTAAAIRAWILGQPYSSVIE